MAENLNKRPKRGILKSSTSFEQRDHPVGDGAAAAGSTSDQHRLKNPHFDESNIAATLHPPDKDYGFMKIDEPKTPYEYNKEELDEEDDEAYPGSGGGGGSGGHNDELNPNILAARIAMEVATGHKHAREDRISEDVDGGGGRSEDGAVGGGHPPRARRLSEPSADEEDLALLSPEERENRRKFEQKRKAHYNEFYALKMARQLMAQEDEEEESADEAGSIQTNNPVSNTTTSNSTNKDSITTPTQHTKDSHEDSMEAMQS